MADMDTALKEIMDIDGAIGVALVDYSSGMALGTVGGGKDLDLTVAAAGNTDVVRAKLRTMEMLEPQRRDRGHPHHPRHPVPPDPAADEPRRGKGLFLYLALRRDRANLAMARHQLKQHRERPGRLIRSRHPDGEGVRALPVSIAASAAAVLHLGALGNGVVVAAVQPAVRQRHLAGRVDPAAGLAQRLARERLGAGRASPAGRPAPPATSPSPARGAGRRRPGSPSGTTPRACGSPRSRAARRPARRPAGARAGDMIAATSPRFGSSCEAAPANAASRSLNSQGRPRQPRPTTTPSTPVCSTMRSASEASQMSPLPSTGTSRACLRVAIASQSAVPE